MHGDVCEIIPGFFIGSAADAEEMVRRGVDVIVQLAWEDESIREAGFRGLLHFAFIEDGGIITDSELEGLIADEIGTDGGMGFCTLYWLTKKRILKERYGIDWKSPADIYKGVIFD